MLKNEQVTKFVEDVASDLPKYGLDKPQLQLTLSSFASENTAETAAGEHPFATIAFGKTDGDNVYARLGDEPFVVAVRRTLLDNIFTDPLQWQELAIFRFKPEEVHKFVVVTDREAALVRNASKEWTWVNGRPCASADCSSAAADPPPGATNRRRVPVSRRPWIREDP